MAGRIEDYALIGDLQTAALVGLGRFDRLALPAPVRLAGLLRRAARRSRATATGGSRRAPGPHARRGDPALPGRHPDPGDRVGDRRRDRPRHRLHARQRTASRRCSCASSRASPGAVTMRMRPAAAVRLRQGPALGAPARRRHRRGRRARLGLAAHPGAAGAATTWPTAASFTVRAGERVPFVMYLAAVAPARARAG